MSDTASLTLEVRRLADRLRSLPQSRLEVRLDPPPALPAGLTGRNRAALAHALAQRLADAAAGVEGREQPRPPARREVPELSVFAVGDQVAVTGTDLAAALRGLEETSRVWGPDGTRDTAGGALAAALEAVRALRAVV